MPLLDAELWQTTDSKLKFAYQMIKASLLGWKPALGMHHGMGLDALASGGKRMDKMTHTAAPADTGRLAPLPDPFTADGGARRVGVELEFTGIDEDRAAAVVAELFGGAVSARCGARVVDVDGVGRFEAYLDTAIGAGTDPSPLMAAARDLGRAVVPLELVTPPLGPDALARLPELCAGLVAAGARGGEGGVLFGFGLHFNVEIQSDAASGVARVAMAYILLEDWLRGTDPIDTSRRVLPFVDPFPRSMVDAAAKRGGAWTWDSLAEDYLTLSPSRNRGLDLLPVLAWKLGDRVAARLEPGVKIGPRPAFHFRLPDCRLGDADWSVAKEWDRWCLVEAVAGTPAQLAQLAAAWQRYRDDPTSFRGAWRQWLDGWLTANGYTR